MSHEKNGATRMLMIMVYTKLCRRHRSHTALLHNYTHTHTQREALITFFPFSQCPPPIIPTRHYRRE